MLTKKDFIYISNEIAKLENPKDRKMVANFMVRVFTNSNPNFDYVRFMNACMVNLND